jgi:hypothetical protein
MIAFRYASLLALALWVGGMAALGALAAPAIFDVLQAHDAEGGRILAGDVFGEVLRRFRLLEYAAALVLLGSLGARAALGRRPAALGVRMGIVTAMLALSLFSGTWLTQQIERMQDEIGVPVASLPGTDPRRSRFGLLHGASTMLMLVNLGGGLALIYHEARS